MRVVYIEWRDADGTRGPYSRQAAMSQTALIVRTVGILVGEDEQVIKLSQDYWKRHEEDGTTPEAFREIETIPRVLIQRREDWDVGEGLVIPTTNVEFNPENLQSHGIDTSGRLSSVFRVL